MEIKYIKSPATLLKRAYVNKRGLDPSKEVLWVSVGQRTAELRAVKVGGQRKIQPLCPARAKQATMYFISIQSDLISIVLIK